ncbi:uncharacterized protein LOC116003992 [Ipomoea triloba]|uniref:uncharacterized protein LOC116003992 n=1 Tax=Ipomoea triloba TaxID=35885 RepID=UPI00125E5F5E|nr:uncharacterized protein LOC116003992 [Ipomoea triloba]
MCGLTNENVMHSLVMCDFSKLVWHEAAITIPSLQENDFAMWFSNLMTMLTMEDILVAVAVVYHIWIARNSAVWKGCLPRPAAVSRRAEAALQAWKQNGDWCCYFDAGYLHTTRMSTAGAVLYMPGGVYAAAFSGRTQGCLSPLMAESMACKEVLSWLRARGVEQVKLYTDCANLQALLSSSHSNLYSYIAFSIQASKAIMSSFIHCSVHLIPRSANLGAHSLATLAFSQAGFLFWDHVPPDIIAGLI